LKVEVGRKTKAKTVQKLWLFQSWRRWR